MSDKNPHNLTEEQVDSAVQQLRSHMASKAGATRGASGDGGGDVLPDHVLEHAVREGFAAAPVGKINFGQIMQIIMAALAAIAPFLPKQPAGQ
jgi:hypothetical protein